jgi:hypothetical protein
MIYVSAVQVSAAAAAMSPATGLFTCLRSHPSNAATTHTPLLLFGLFCGADVCCSSSDESSHRAVHLPAHPSINDCHGCT